MRFSLQVGMCEPDHYLALARAAESAGFHGVAVSDSICYPQEASSKYPYNKDGSREFLESVPFVEALIAVAAMAAVTEKLRFSTFVYKLAVRQAPVVAKQVQGIQVLSGTALTSALASARGRRILRSAMSSGKSVANVSMSKSISCAAWRPVSFLVTTANSTRCRPIKCVRSRVPQRRC